MNSLIFCVCISEILSVAAIMYFPALLPSFQVEWGLSNTEAGWISGIYFGGYAASVPILVSLTDRVDPRKIYLLSAGLGAVSMIGFGLVAQGIWTATAFRLLAGISFAGTYMPGVKALSDRISGVTKPGNIFLYGFHWYWNRPVRIFGGMVDPSFQLALGGDINGIRPACSDCTLCV